LAQIFSSALLAQAAETNNVAPAAPTADKPALNQGSSESFTSVEAALQSGIKYYHESKFAQAQEDFQKALDLDPKSIPALTNLALAQFQNGNKGWALALLRKATTLDPNFSTLKQAQDFIYPQLEVKELPHEILLSETLHQRILAPVSIFWFSVLSALFILACGWSLLSFFGARKRALEQDLPNAQISFLSVIFALGAVLCIVLFGLKLFDQKNIRATVVAAKVAALSLPDDKAPSLFDLSQGLEVLIDKEQIDDNKKTWSQVTYPGGPTGWVPKSSLFVTTEN
jgi:tetratricopeptide (TPR) repeat protein